MFYIGEKFSKMKYLFLYIQTAEIDLPGEYDELNPSECNVSITAKYPIGKHKAHTASMDIGPINLTRCDTVCYENLGKNLRLCNLSILHLHPVLGYALFFGVTL